MGSNSSYSLLNYRQLTAGDYERIRTDYENYLLSCDNYDRKFLNQIFPEGIPDKVDTYYDNLEESILGFQRPDNWDSYSSTLALIGGDFSHYKQNILNSFPASKIDPDNEDHVVHKSGPVCNAPVKPGSQIAVRAVADVSEKVPDDSMAALTQLKKLIGNAIQLSLHSIDEHVLGSDKTNNSNHPLGRDSYAVYLEALALGGDSLARNQLTRYIQVYCDPGDSSLIYQVDHMMRAFEQMTNLALRETYDNYGKSEIYQKYKASLSVNNRDSSNALSPSQNIQDKTWDFVNLIFEQPQAYHELEVYEGSVTYKCQLQAAKEKRQNTENSYEKLMAMNSPENIYDILANFEMNKTDRDYLYHYLGLTQDVLDLADERANAHYEYGDRFGDDKYYRGQSQTKYIPANRDCPSDVNPKAWALALVIADRKHEIEVTNSRFQFLYVGLPILLGAIATPFLTPAGGGEVALATRLGLAAFYTVPAIGVARLNINESYEQLYWAQSIETAHELGGLHLGSEQQVAILERNKNIAWLSGVVNVGMCWIPGPKYPTLGKMVGREAGEGALLGLIDASDETDESYYLATGKTRSQEEFAWHVTKDVVGEGLVGASMGGVGYGIGLGARGLLSREVEAVESSVLRTEDSDLELDLDVIGSDYADEVTAPLALTAFAK